MAAPIPIQKVLVVLGTRPEIIKLAPVIHALQKHPAFEAVVVATGQHKEMAEPLFNLFNIVPDYHMNVMQPGQPLAALAGKILTGLQTIIEETRPDIMVVQGDTTSAFIAALTAFYSYDWFIRHKDFSHKHPIKIAHVEAGLRTHNLYAPFPEEANRAIISRLAHWHFAPTPTAAEALLEENVPGNIHITGNTVIDALLSVVDTLKHAPRPLPVALKENERMILVTGHRRESYGVGFQNICLGLKNLAEKYPHDRIVYPVHLHPNVKGPVMELLGNIPNINLLAPLDYPDFVNLMLHSHLILTDSGGVQEEAPSLGKPVLVLRDITERPEAVMAGAVRVVGTNPEKIVAEASKLLDDEKAHAFMANAINPYGDGLAAQRIVNLMAGEPADENTFKVEGE